MSAPLLELDALSVDYPVAGAAWRRSCRLRAVAGVSFSLAAGDTLGIVGESGCGKSTLARAILGLVPTAAGVIRWRGELLPADGRRSRGFRRAVQMVFQAVYDSLDPRLQATAALLEPLRALRPELDAPERNRRLRRMLESVGLAAATAERRPRALSLGQCQRIGIGRALIVQPELLVCDEPVSSLDVSIQAQILNLLLELRREHDLALLLISHDLAVVRLLCRRIVVLYLGRVVEMARRESLFERPRHPYTRALLAAIAAVRARDAERAQPLAGEPPSAISPPSGCVFRGRCPHATAICAERIPPLETVAAGHTVACHHWRQLPP